MLIYLIVYMIDKVMTLYYPSDIEKFKDKVMIKIK
jgi:hypothetical protein